MKLWRFTFEGAYLGGVAFVFAADADSAREALIRSVPERWLVETWADRIRAATVCQEMIPTFTAVMYIDDGDY